MVFGLFKKLDRGKPLYNLEVKLDKTWGEWKPMLEYWFDISGPNAIVELAEIVTRARGYCGDFIVTNKDFMLRGYKLGIETKVAELNILEPSQALASKNKFHKPFIDSKGNSTNFSSGIFGGPVYFPDIKLPVHAHLSDGKIISYIKEGNHFKITDMASQKYADKINALSEKYSAKA